MTGFFYDGEKGVQNFTSVTDERPDLSFLPFPIDKVAILECCNGLVLCLCVEAAGSRYVVCNLGTKNLQVLPPSINAVGQARLWFNPTASSHFHVIEFVEEEGTECLGVEIYSSQTAAWIYKESEWGQNIDDVIRSRSASVFRNGCLHIMGYSLILVVDMEEKTWRKIPRPCGTPPFIHQA
ncbi:uncharacterized protein [Miscanthus floridulus]|uniref:uncharacterized protein n=1 Tax=Miscanthus floridulus TaxID=154761 RepID=UPI0034585CAF